MVVTESGYETNQGYRLLDKLIACFWDHVDEDQVKGKELKDYEFSDLLRPDLRIITVASFAELGTVFIGEGK
jgi:hypothetical protein